MDIQKEDPSLIETLKPYRWAHPSSYGGFSPDGDYVVASYNRDSKLLERANFEAFKSALESAAKPFGDAPCLGDMHREYVYTWRARHWGCGWVEYLGVRSDAPYVILKTAGDILDAMADYPIIDDELHSFLESEEVEKAWDQASMNEKIDYCRNAEISIFAAREEMPRSEVFERIREQI
ncbi:hypothetical protein [Thioalkalivibrio thiocyanodenitrificans]|uniref:hypothetical protein n=1 Tax=Thioalkalivibrio thiocyanodenitrificans TaxID=243063 RepID=UPI0003826372|nr:hypothetical protein [Thioalkalivibrio thiocyanodenitrificans]